MNRCPFWLDCHLQPKHVARTGGYVAIEWHRVAWQLLGPMLCCWPGFAHALELQAILPAFELPFGTWDPHRLAALGSRYLNESLQHHRIPELGSAPSGTKQKELR